jgi:hypothetical protein
MKNLGSRTDPKDIVSQEQLAALGQVFRIETIASGAAGQTSYAVPNGYTPGAVLVFLNGALQQPTDYAASDGANVVLAAGAWAVTDVVQVVVLSAIRAQDDALLAYTVAQLPPAASNKYKQRYCTNMAGGEGPVFSNGTKWLRVSDNTEVTT